MTKFIRYHHQGRDSYGILDGQTVRELDGDLFQHRETGATHKLAEVKLLPPCTPSKILAVGLNYGSHLNGRPAPAAPEIFYKPVSCLIATDEPIVIPKDAKNVHSEGELVIVIGPDSSIFGVTCGNDVSERDWQHGPNKDLQWWRAKGSDTFGPLGPAILTGIDFSNLLLQTRYNGETVQKQYTSDLMFNCPAIVDYVRQWVTLAPGDVIYTGTPGSTKKMNPGDTVEVEIEGIGVLRNRVA
ncbi:MAG: fumarylacetoacetate hydrolase family protein [Acidobacteriia bacterium]|nr:fumarylacetoacetate hydrolase family protein [Terriglobia bacterium]